MLVDAAVTFHAVLEIAYSLMQVLAADLRGCMLVASVAGVLREITFRMAGCACRESSCAFMPSLVHKGDLPCLCSYPTGVLEVFTI